MATAIVKPKKCLQGVKLEGTILINYLQDSEIYFEKEASTGEDFFYVGAEDTVSFIVNGKTYTAEQVTIVIEESNK